MRTSHYGGSQGVRWCCGYTLIEMMIAGGILMAAVAAAAILASSVIKIQEGNERVMRALNVQEQSARLYQLGLNLDRITNIIAESFSNSATPPDGMLSLTFGTNQTNVSGAGTVDVATNTIVYPAGLSNSTVLHRTNRIIVVRPSSL